MSIQYDKEILSNSNYTLKVNFSGIKDSIATAENLKMSIYSYSKTGAPLFSETLNYDQIKLLYHHLEQISIIRDSSSTISGKFIESSSEIGELVAKLGLNSKTNLLKSLLITLDKDEKISNILSALSDLEVDTLFAYQRCHDWKKEIENLQKLLELEDAGNIVQEINRHPDLHKYSAGQPEKIFQNWIDKNHLWIFGVEYVKKHDVRQISLYSEGDLLMESIDGFLDLIELKRPSNAIFGKVDVSHKSYYPSSDLSKVIGQCLYYLQKMDDIKLNLEKEYKIKIIRPRIKIITGRTNNYTDDQYSALRMLNCSLNNIEIISYDSLIKYGEKMIACYT
ncbi:Shedu anti-phage system protein SduA domain-containing protein [Chitinophaga rhizophila]|uniref:DUF4263 domain-containing protein n=1 Tax=Chitinophaga rhizophila TaxID=2866212 RepID=A0ABS7GJ50_9BACT|nr:Shedu anti-phage system protein SduA domain-containing protein [Chitinophaga rhizophila]MBW8687747.1 DUF4263 domain-containing protein [Chitinophaga rhizophila]